MRATVAIMLTLLCAVASGALSSCLWYTQEPSQNEAGQPCKETSYGLLMFRTTSVDCSPGATNVPGNALHPPLQLAPTPAPPPAS
ncbi:MAG TPA: hypothetical protein VEJ86_07735 [Candidatus Binataceae bacterium]|nr:hypothetical protein [Candidatus Binataceae bacterium]